MTARRLSRAHQRPPGRRLEIGRAQGGSAKLTDCRIQQNSADECVAEYVDDVL
jgi:hypothetical protein